MNKNELIEAIIKEVRNVLAERGVDIEPVSGVQTPPGVTPVSLPQPPSTAGYSTVGNHDLTGNQVITEKDMETFTGTSIQVTRKAVITPLALDYAKEKNITITRVEESSVRANESASSPRAVSVALVISPDFAGDGGIVSGILRAKGFHIRDFPGQSYEGAVKNLANAVASDSAAFGICIEKTGMEGPIYANRNTKIRAVHCRDSSSARAAKIDFGANVVVIDSASNPESVISGFIGM